MSANVPFVPFDDSAFFVTRGLYVLRNVNMNSTADQELLPVIAPAAGMRFRLTSVLGIGASTSLTTAVGGIYTGAGKTGTAIIPASTAWSSMTATDTALVVANTTAPNPQSIVLPSSTRLYLSLTTAQGAAATLDWVIVQGFAVPA